MINYRLTFKYRLIELNYRLLRDWGADERHVMQPDSGPVIDLRG